MNSDTQVRAPVASADDTGIAIARRYLAAMERRDLDEATSLVHAQASFVFPGGATRTSLADIVAGSDKRYQFVGKTIERCDASVQDGVTVVYVIGMLHGRWLDGQSFEGIRFIDRFEIEAGLIRRQEVWNDAGEVRAR